MSEFTSRLIKTAVGSGLLRGKTRHEQTRDVLFAFMAALQPLLTMEQLDQAHDTQKSFRQPLYLFALYLGLYGIEIPEMLNADLSMRELAGPEPGRAAPIPDASGLMHDPATGKPVIL
jgi:hypothetical protein